MGELDKNLFEMLACLLCARPCCRCSEESRPRALLHGACLLMEGSNSKQKKREVGVVKDGSERVAEIRWPGNPLLSGYLAKVCKIRE